MNCMATATAMAAVENAISKNSHDSSVLALRAIEAAPDHARRMAVEKLDAHVRNDPHERKQHVVDLLISLRSV